MAEAVIHIDDVIGEGWFGGIASSSVRDALVEHASAKEVTVRINSPGGDAVEGVAIYVALKRHGARVIVEVDGLAASAASIIAMAGDEIRMHKGALLMIHEASTFTRGTADELRKQAAVLQKVNGEMADLYAARTGMNAVAVLQLMAAETWLTADEALERGFATAVVPAKTAPQAEPKARAHAMLSAYKHVPEALRVAAQAAATLLSPKPGEPARARLGDILNEVRADGVPTWRGQVFADLAPTEKALLKRQDAALFDRMRVHYTREAKTYAQLSGPEKAALYNLDHAKYVRMRDAGARGTETWVPRLVSDAEQSRGQP